jgi:peptide/nickel transport system ATP-binding protein
MMAPLLAVENLTVEIATRRGPLVAVDDVSFSIGEGEVLGLVGESGAGKSLTGMAVLGLLDPPSRQAGGRVVLRGERLDDLSPEALRRHRGRDIGAVFQDPLTSLNPLLTVGHQLVQTITTHLDVSPSRARERALRLLGEVGIPAAAERLGSYPHELSGGMRQRIVLALAFACEPQLIIADEPTTALDVSTQAQIIELLRGMCRERGTAILLITHDLGVIAETAHRLAVMYAGRLVEIGPTRGVIRSASHPYTRGLMASIPSRRRRGMALTQIEGSMPRLDALPTGCAFHPRCAHAISQCREHRPDLDRTETGFAACWRAGRIAAMEEQRLEPSAHA